MPHASQRDQVRYKIVVPGNEHFPLDDMDLQVIRVAFNPSRNFNFALTLQILSNFIGQRTNEESRDIHCAKCYPTWITAN